MPALDWSRDKASWPHAAASRFVEAGGWRWHVQHWRSPGVLRSEKFGKGSQTAVRERAATGERDHSADRAETVLLLHGTGASAHSFRQLAPRLAQRFEVLVPDLPGHAFTTSTSGRDVTLPAVAEAVAALLKALDARATVIVGHSAGAAIGAQMCLARLAAPRQLVSINGALLPLQGPIQQWFSPLAKWLVVNPLVPHLFAWQAAQPGAVQRLLASTGSRIDDDGVALYGRLVADARHAAGALRLMASWHLSPLAAALPRLRTPLTLVVGSRDGTVPPAQGREVQRRVPGARLAWLEGLGHLAHEEDPGRVLEAFTPQPCAGAARSVTAVA